MKISMIASVALLSLLYMAVASSALSSNQQDGPGIIYMIVYALHQHHYRIHAKVDNMHACIIYLVGSL